MLDDKAFHPTPINRLEAELLIHTTKLRKFHYIKFEGERERNSEGVQEVLGIQRPSRRHPEALSCVQHNWVASNRCCSAPNKATLLPTRRPCVQGGVRGIPVGFLRLQSTVSYCFPSSKSLLESWEVQAK